MQVLRQVLDIGQSCPDCFLPPLAFIYLFLGIWHKTPALEPRSYFQTGGTQLRWHLGGFPGIVLRKYGFLMTKEH